MEFAAFARSPADCTETLQTNPLKPQASSYWTTNNGVSTECRKGERQIRTHRVGVQMSSCDQMRTSPLGSTCGTPCNLLQVRRRFTSQTWNEIGKHTIFAWTNCQLWNFALHMLKWVLHCLRSPFPFSDVLWKHVQHVQHVLHTAGRAVSCYVLMKLSGIALVTLWFSIHYPVCKLCKVRFSTISATWSPLIVFCSSTAEPSAFS